MALVDQGSGATPRVQKTARLRIIATTDLHMQLLGHDYVANEAAPACGLSGLASLIHKTRNDAHAEGMATVLVDNGDTLQGSPLADWIAAQPVGPDHPMVSAFNLLKYDAVGLGNHDFDYGSGYLRAVARQLDMPVVCSNLRGIAFEPVSETCLVHAASPDGDTIKVGVISVLPPQTLIWENGAPHEKAHIIAPVPCVKQAAERLKNSGADVIIVLAHMGPDTPASAVECAPAIGGLADISEVDALILGHTHQRLADPVASENGADLPMVMPGHQGSDLGIIDLSLEQSQTGAWRSISATSRLVPHAADTPVLPAVARLVDDAHAKVTQALELPVTKCDQDLTSYFALLQPGLSSLLLAYAKEHAVRTILADSAESALPLIAASATHYAGGRSGPAHFLNIPAGTIKLRHLGGLNPFANRIWAVRKTGRALRAWLERSARIFATLTERQPDQLLLNRLIPSFAFDTIAGLSYQIDPTIPPQTTTGRIRNLRYLGLPVEDDQVFLVATNQFRAAGGGGYAATACEDVIVRTAQLKPTDFVAAFDRVAAEPLETLHPWQLQRGSGRQAILETAPEAHAHLEEIAAFSPEPLGLSERGFLRVRVTL